jgi:hypothetical protein
MWSSSHDRASVLRAVSQLAGRASSRQDFAFRFSQDSQLATYMARRIDATVAKFMYAVAECYVRGLAAPLLTVGGARVQHGTGDSQWRLFQGRNYLFGTEAAHFGIGTLTLASEGVSEAGLSRVRNLARQQGIKLRDIHAELPANGQLVTFGLVNDAATFLAPAFFNQSEGKLEVEKQRLMRGLLGMPVPQSADQLEGALAATGERVIEFLTERRKVAVDPIDERLSAIGAGVQKEYLQHPEDLPNLVFSGEERQALEAMRSQASDSHSELKQNTAQIERNVGMRANWLAGVAEAAKEESS